MQRTLISFLGTGDYSDTVYQWTGFGEHRTKHVAAALGTLWKASQIVVLATDQAEVVNGQALRDSMAAASLRQPLFKRLPDGRTQAELWAHFQAMHEAIALSSGAEVLIDVTHGYRAQPFFACAVTSLLRAAGRGPADVSVVYGEHRPSEPVSPVWDLTLFVELMDWAQALGLFLKTGVAEGVVQLGEKMRKRDALRAKAAGSGDFPRFGQLVAAIDRFAGDLATIRVASIITGYEQDDSRKEKAIGGAANLLAAVEQCRSEVRAKIPPLALILDELAEMVQPLAAQRLFGKDGERAQEALAHHIEHGGFRKQPASAKNLQGRIRNLVQRLAQREAAPLAPARTFFVSRHAGAKAWVESQGLAIHRMIDHLDLPDIRAGDAVIGTLPVHLAAEVCARRARYLHLTIDMPPESRGLELTAEDMTRLGARLVEYRVSPMGPISVREGNDEWLPR